MPGPGGASGAEGGGGPPNREARADLLMARVPGGAADPGGGSVRGQPPRSFYLAGIDNCGDDPASRQKPPPRPRAGSGLSDFNLGELGGGGSGRGGAFGDFHTKSY